MKIYQKIMSKSGCCLNDEFREGFLDHYQRKDSRKTHYFGGRYENIYLTEQHIPVLGSLIIEATNHAKNILQLKKLRAGFWFNFMPPKSTTTLHTHKEDGELLSVVYYVDVTEETGSLILYDKSNYPVPRKIE